MNIAQASPRPAPAPAPAHQARAQAAHDQFQAAWTVAAAPEPDAVTAVRHVRAGVALLGLAYASIPADGYHPGNELLTRSWAMDAVHELGAGDFARARATLDSILERVSNDFDLP